MKKLIARLAFAAAAAVCLTTFGDETWTINGKEWSYVVENGEATIVGVDDPSGNLAIPSTVGSGNIPVTAIGAEAFSNSGELEAVTLPESVETIGGYAFGWCGNLSSVSLGGAKCIGVGAFYWCESLEAVVIPDSVTNICGGAFTGCTSLSDVTIGRGVSRIGDPAIPHFYDEEYDEWITVDFDPAFGNCESLVNFKLASGNATYELIGGSLYYSATPNSAKTLAVYPPGRTEFVLPDGITVTAIGEGACSGCGKLTELTIPTSIRDIGVEAFAHCEGITKVLIQPNTVTNISFGAFAWNMNTMDVEVAGSVKTIGEWAFMHNFGPYDLYDEYTTGRLVLHDGIVSIGVEAFHRGFRIGEIVIPDSVTSMGDGAFGANRLVRRVVIGSGLDRIGEEAFECDWGSKLSEIVIGPNVKTIGDFAFSGCESLRVLNVPEGVTSIGDYAFSGCSSLCVLNLPSTLTHIGEGAFGSPGGYYYASAPKGGNARLGSGAATLGGCTFLRRVLVPAGVEHVGSNAFASVRTDLLDRIYLPASLRPSGDDETEAYLNGLFPEMDLGADDVVWYDDAGDLNYVTVTYNPNNGDAATFVQVLDYADSLPVPSRDGYAFAGWWTSLDDSGEQITMFSCIEQDTVCYAHWVETPVTFGGDAPWTADYDEEKSAWILSSGDVGFGFSSIASMSVTGPCVVSFEYRNRISGYYDDLENLQFLVDGEVVDSYTGTKGWTPVNYELLESGEHTVAWRYVNMSGSYEDHAWLYGISATAAQPHTVTFNLAGGTMSVPTTRTVLRSVGSLPIPSKTGGVFAGWWTTSGEEGEVVASDYKVDGDITLYAHWIDAPFTGGGDRCWLLDEDGYYMSEPLAVEEVIYAEIRTNGPCQVSFYWKADTDYWTNNHFDFYVDGERKTSIQASSRGNPYWDSIMFDVEGEGEHVLRWEFRRVEGNWGSNENSNRVWLRDVVVNSINQVTFDENYEGGKSTPYLIGGDVLGRLPVPARDDYYLFTGWYTLPDGGVQVTSDTPVTESVTYYAHWTAAAFKFTGTWVVDSDGSYRSAEMNSYSSCTASRDVEGPCRVTFKWKFASATGSASASIEDIKGDDFNRLVSTTETTSDWVEETLTISDGSVHTLRFLMSTGYMPSLNNYLAIKDFNVELLPSYTVTFNPNYQGGGAATIGKVIQDAAIGELPVLGRDGYVMNGWWTAATGGERISAATEIHADSTYYAHWVECPFTFSGVRPWEMGPDGELRTAPMTVYGDYYATATVQGPCIVTFEWKSSVGYSGRYMRLDVDGSYNDRCESGDWEQKTIKLPGEGEHTVLFDAYVNNLSYATAGENCFMVRNYNVSELVPSVVTFNANYAGGENSTRNYVAGDAIGELPSAARSGYALIGWFTAASGGEQVTASTVVNGDMTVYAHWMEAVSFDSTGGDANWTVESDGTWRSGKITDYQNTWAQVTVNGPCDVTFRWKTSSESNYDFLTFTDNDVNVNRISGVMADWVEVNYSVEDAGSHTLKWTYSKDGSASNGSDCGWVKDFVVAYPAPSAPPVVIDDTKMEEPVDNGDGTRTIAAKDGETLTQEDAAGITIKSSSDPLTDITAAYNITLDTDKNEIVIELAQPAIDEVEEANKDEDDATGLLEDVAKIEASKIAEMPTPDTSDPDPAKHEEVGAMPVKMHKGLWYQASWGDSLNGLTSGVKFQADGSQTHIGVIKQTGASGFYKITVSEK